MLVALGGMVLISGAPGGALPEAGELRGIALGLGAAILYACVILRGGGVMGKFMISTFTDLILRVVLAVVLSKTALGATGIWCAWPVGWSVATVLSVLFYKQGYWNRMEETSE